MKVEFEIQLQMEKAFIASYGISWQEEWGSRVSKLLLNLLPAAAAPSCISAPPN